ncbi:AlpA family transcriptional regulator [Streptomyces sp. CAI-85]|uniref:helix-turn-helix transcriptional regulator n=1 Tax=Streptomyces sp. CAI-85 TaxID=1472662 RepID=UPI0020CA33A0|nr:helix-turn-helix domain-containing protein [Streptomyces sp. CAI-85]
MARTTLPKPAAAKPRPMATAQDVADYFRVPIATVYQWNYKGTGPKFRKIGRHVRYRWDDVEAFDPSQPA